jgi:hypothetical protein
MKVFYWFWILCLFKAFCFILLFFVLSASPLRAEESDVLKELQKIQEEVSEAKEKSTSKVTPKDSKEKIPAWTKIEPKRLPKSDKSIEEEAEEILGGITTRVRKKRKKKSQNPASQAYELQAVEKEILSDEGGDGIPKELRRSREPSSDPSVDIIDDGLDTGDHKDR